LYFAIAAAWCAIEEEREGEREGWIKTRGGGKVRREKRRESERLFLPASAAT